MKRAVGSAGGETCRGKRGGGVCRAREREGYHHLPPPLGALDLADAQQPPRLHHRHLAPPAALQPPRRRPLPREVERGGLGAEARLHEREDAAQLPRARRLAPPERAGAQEGERPTKHVVGLSEAEVAEQLARRVAHLPRYEEEVLVEEDEEEEEEVVLVVVEASIKHGRRHAVKRV